jgi:hypothetical protein
LQLLAEGLITLAASGTIHPSTSSAVIVWTVVDKHLFLNIIPINFLAEIGRKVWCDRDMSKTSSNMIQWPKLSVEVEVPIIRPDTLLVAPCIIVFSMMGIVQKYLDVFQVVKLIVCIRVVILWPDIRKKRIVT